MGYMGSDGTQHDSEYDRDYHDKVVLGKNQNNKGGDGGGFMGQAGGAGMGIFLMIIAIGPVILAAIGGLLFGILFKLKTVGRIIQAVIVGFVFLIIGLFVLNAISLSVSGLLFVYLELSLPLKILCYLALAVVATLANMWYFNSLYPVFKSMGTLMFTITVKNTFCFGWFGFLGANIIGLFNRSLVTPITIVSLIAGAVYFLVKMKAFSEEAKEEKAALPKARIAGLISVICLLPLFAWAVIGTEKGANQEIRAEYKAERLHNQTIVDVAKKATTQRITVIVTKAWDKGEVLIFPTVGTSRDWDGYENFKRAKVGDTLTITGEAIQHGKNTYYVPVDYQGNKGFVDVDYIELQD